MMLSDLFVIKMVIEDILLGVFDPRAKKKNKGQTMALKKLPLKKNRRAQKIKQEPTRAAVFSGEKNGRKSTLNMRNDGIW